MERTSHTSPIEKEKAAVRAAKIWELYKRGATYKHAGAAVNVTESAARRAFLRVLRRVPIADVREWRQLQIERYSAALTEINLYQIAHPEQLIECVKTKVRILNGLNDILGNKRLVLKVDAASRWVALRDRCVTVREHRGVVVSASAVNH
jgi:hypothetical protein